MTVTGSPKLFMITERRLSDGSVHVAISGTKINQTDESHRVHVFWWKLQKSIKNHCFIGRRESTVKVWISWIGFKPSKYEEIYSYCINYTVSGSKIILHFRFRL